MSKALTLLGKADCDPASPTDDQGHLIVPAVAHLGDGLHEKWAGNILLCPTDDFSLWLDKALAERKAGNVANVVIIFPALTAEPFAQRLLSTYPVCFTAHDSFMISYLGPYVRRFDSVFFDLGTVVIPF